MIKVFEYICNDCKTVFDIAHVFSVICPSCRSTDTSRKWSAVAISVKKGKCGNASNGYSS